MSLVAVVQGQGRLHNLMELVQRVQEQELHHIVKEQEQLGQGLHHILKPLGQHHNQKKQELQVILHHSLEQEQQQVLHMQEQERQQLVHRTQKERQGRHILHHHHLLLE